MIAVPPDTFLVRHGNDGYGAEIVTGRVEANKAFASLFGSASADALRFAENDDNWSLSEGKPVTFSLNIEGGIFGEVIRITFPEEKK